MGWFPITRRAIWRLRLAWGDLRFVMASEKQKEARRQVDKAHAAWVRIRNQEPPK